MSLNIGQFTSKNQLDFKAFYEFTVHNISYSRKPSDWSLNKAKKNIINKYVAVGYLENLVPFYKLLERKIPSYFKGIVHLYKDRGKNLVIL